MKPILNLLGVPEIPQEGNRDLYELKEVLDGVVNEKAFKIVRNKWESCYALELLSNNVNSIVISPKIGPFECTVYYRESGDKIGKLYSAKDILSNIKFDVETDRISPPSDRIDPKIREGIIEVFARLHFNDTSGAKETMKTLFTRLLGEKMERPLHQETNKLIDEKSDIFVDEIVAYLKTINDKRPNHGEFVDKVMKALDITPQ